MHLKGIVVEDFVNYKLPSLFLATSTCSFKCCTEQNLDIGVCQNAPLTQSPTFEISNDSIYNYFISNPITQAVVLGGLEPLDQFEEVESLIEYFRNHGEDCRFVIYTGYYPHEIRDKIQTLKLYKNITMKYGRFLLTEPSIYDDTLGVTLMSDNQWAEDIS